jgi:hypothetical protein
MRLIRNMSPDGRCKYAIIDNRTGEKVEAKVGDPEEFFVLKLKDYHTAAALRAYAASVMRGAENDDEREYGREVDALAARAEVMPNRKWPD